MYFETDISGKRNKTKPQKEYEINCGYIEPGYGRLCPEDFANRIPHFEDEIKKRLHVSLLHKTCSVDIYNDALEQIIIRKGERFSTTHIKEIAAELCGGSFGIRSFISGDSPEAATLQKAYINVLTDYHIIFDDDVISIQINQSNYPPTKNSLMLSTQAARWLGKTLLALSDGHLPRKTGILDSIYFEAKVDERVNKLDEIHPTPKNQK